MKIFIFTLAIAILLFALFVGFQISPIITSIFISPITYLSSFFNDKNKWIEHKITNFIQQQIGIKKQRIN